MLKKDNKSTPPNLMRGLFSSIVAVVGTILISTWAIINYQVDELVTARTSEYAHSIAQIAANSVADSLHKKNHSRMKLLVNNVATVAYINSVTIFAEDGQIIIQHSQANNNKTPQQQKINPSALTNENDLTQDFLHAETDIPFIKKITRNNITIGWFKVTLNKSELEKDFRQSLLHAQQIIGVISLLLLIMLFITSTRYQKKIKHLIALNHKLIQINTPQLPRDETQWFTAIQELSKAQMNLIEPKQLQSNNSEWLSNNRIEDSLFCYIQFSMEEQNDEETASCLTLAENYLRSAIQAHGLHSQGNLLSGCLIPLFDNSNKKDMLLDMFALTHCIKKLLLSLTLPIKIRAFIGSGTILILKNERAEMTGFSLSNRSLDKIYKLSAQINFNSIISLGFDLTAIDSLGKFKPIEKAPAPNCFLLKTLSKTIQQQVNRQITYIKKSNPI